MMKPSASNAINACIRHACASSTGRKIEAASISSHETTAYASATLSTWRRFSSEKKEGLWLMTLRVNRVWPARSCIEDHHARRATTDRLKESVFRYRDCRTRFATIRMPCLSHLAQHKPRRFER